MGSLVNDACHPVGDEAAAGVAGFGGEPGLAAAYMLAVTPPPDAALPDAQAAPVAEAPKILDTDHADPRRSLADRRASLLIELLRGRLDELTWIRCPHPRPAAGATSAGPAEDPPRPSATQRKTSRRKAAKSSGTDE